MTGVTVAAIAREPWPVLRRFLTWHLDQGVERILLYLDDPNDPAIPRLMGEPRVEVRPCTRQFWQSLGLSPDTRFTRRQRHVYAHAYRDVADGWLLFVDADELMWLQGGMKQRLQDLPEDAKSLRVQSAEQVKLSGGADAFRTPIDRKAVNRVYGADADYLRIRFGLVYRPEGKSFHRAGQTGLNIKLHWAETSDGARSPGPVIGRAEDAYLIHYAAQDYDRWRAKVDWRSGARGFSQPVVDQLTQIAHSPDPEAGYKDLFDTLHFLTKDRAAALEAEGGLLRDGPL